MHPLATPIGAIPQVSFADRLYGSLGAGEPRTIRLARPLDQVAADRKVPCLGASFALAFMQKIRRLW